MTIIIFTGIITLIINNIIPKKNIFILTFLKSKREDTGEIYQKIGLIGSIITLYTILIKILIFNYNNNEFQDRIEYFGYSFGLDGLGLSMIALICILEPILLILIKGENKIKEERKRIVNYLIIIKILIVILFACLDLLIFFITFELILIPMFLLITRYGSSYKFFIPRLEAGIRFFMFTMIGSILMFLTIIIFYLLFGTTNNELLNLQINEIVSSTTLTPNISNNKLFIILKISWIFLFFSFLIKIPMFPFHTWLPLAHSDAPTIGSIILAALLLKLASFGILRYSLYLYEPLSKSEDLIYNSFLPIIFILSLISIIYCSFIPLRGLYDFKKIIAYSSITHMNFSIFGFFSKDYIGLSGSSLLMFTHAFISSALFLLIGILYKRYHSRFLPYFQGLSNTMPIFAFFFLFFSFANISLPFCSSFLSEFFILVSSFHFNPFLSIILLLSLVLSSAFVIWFANRLLFGSPSVYLNNISEKDIQNYTIIGSKDITLTEFFALFPFFFFTLFFTFFPKPILNFFIFPLTLFI